MAWVFNPFTGTFDYSILSAGGVLPPSQGGTGTSTVFTTGSVVFAGASGVYTQDNANFFWDDSNNRLGLGTATPATRLHVATGNIRLDDSQTIQWGGGNNYITGSEASSLIQFFQSGTEAMRIATTNNVVIGTVTPTAKLTVTQTTAGASAARLTGVSGAKLILDFIGNGTSYLDNNVLFFRNAAGTSSIAEVGVSGFKCTGSGSALGFGTGAGGAVTQGTSRTTPVSLSTQCGAITLFSAAGSATPTTFTVNNVRVAAADQILVTQASGTDRYIISVTKIVAGASFDITFYTTGGTTVEQPVFNFAILTGATS
jgi:hypothetical protein